ncbi:MAG: DUF4229 domain-containing protein [Ornithinimicrobium sp.]|uniref:DUF4229 domain-containing protein n=1 Tax=Ornithinimicrobium sp. TaxID=1977084 RepID=UPI0026DEA74C|nr:DUF4229 domain-containing protein [Ornithinimicrobium sp.]MDO5739237.1 DUF4229 domain-containing protein [Ornithinimicrobium sp.]
MIAVRYTMMRLLVFFGFFAVLLLVKIPWIYAALGAALLSMAASFFLLARDREAIAAGLERRVEGRVARRNERADSERTLEEEEDLEIDGAEAPGGPDRP